MDIFNNYALQREELLARIAQELQLDKTRIEKMESAYKAVFELLKKDEEFFKDLEVELYAQGSKRIGTTVKPINGDDFDLDAVMHIYDLHSKYQPHQIYDALVRVIESDAYYQKIYEKKDRCIRLNYKSDFHMDILPACMCIVGDKNRIAIPERSKKFWSFGNPKGFSDWFLIIANSVKTTLLKRNSDFLIKAQVEFEDLPEELYLKTPLQRAVQLIKRYRDIYYQKKDYPVSSIVLTTLMAKFYNGEESIFETIDNAISKIQKSYNESTLAKTKFKVLNPVDANEDFTDSWTAEDYKSFSQFIADFHSKWQKLKNSFEEGKGEYIELFGEGIYKKSLTEQIKRFSYTSKNEITKATGLILGNSAMTDSKGQINPNQGAKNEPHHNYGG